MWATRSCTAIHPSMLGWHAATAGQTACSETNFETLIWQHKQSACHISPMCCSVTAQHGCSFLQHRHLHLQSVLQNFSSYAGKQLHVPPAAGNKACHHAGLNCIAWIASCAAIVHPCCLHMQTAVSHPPPSPPFCPCPLMIIKTQCRTSRRSLCIRWSPK